MKKHIQKTDLLGRSFKMEVATGAVIYFKAFQIRGNIIVGSDEENMTRILRTQSILNVFKDGEKIPFSAK